MTDANFAIRQAKPSDARALNRYIRYIFGVSRHLITRPEEFGTGIFKQRWWIAGKAANPLETCLISVGNGQITGMLDSWTDSRARVSHVTTFAMSVHPEWQRHGIGEALLQEFITWVQKNKRLEKIELHVHADNAPALALYKKLGFQTEGTRRDAIRYSAGRTVDDVLMALWPKKEELNEET